MYGGLIIIMIYQTSAGSILPPGTDIMVTEDGLFNMDTEPGDVMITE